MGHLSATGPFQDNAGERDRRRKKKNPAGVSRPGNPRTTETHASGCGEQGGRVEAREAPVALLLLRLGTDNDQAEGTKLINPVFQFAVEADDRPSVANGS